MIGGELKRVELICHLMAKWFHLVEQMVDKNDKDQLIEGKFRVFTWAYS